MKGDCETETVRKDFLWDAQCKIDKFQKRTLVMPTYFSSVAATLSTAHRRKLVLLVKISYSYNIHRFSWLIKSENGLMGTSNASIDILSVVHVFSDSVQWRAELLEHAVAILWIHKCHEISPHANNILKPTKNQGALTFLALLCFKFRKMTSLPLLAGIICFHERSPKNGSFAQLQHANTFAQHAHISNQAALVS